MTVLPVKPVRWMLGAAVGIACLVVGDGAALVRGVSLAAPANARAAYPSTTQRTAAVARRAHRRAVVVSETIPLNFGYSAGATSFFGYAPGTYGGVGCYPGPYGLSCPP